MKNLINFNEFLWEKKIQVLCEECGEPIKDPNKDCPKCGTFPSSAYHQSAIKNSYQASLAQTSEIFQKNQRISE